MPLRAAFLHVCLIVGLVGPARADEILVRALAAGEIARADSYAFDWRRSVDEGAPIVWRYDPRVADGWTVSAGGDDDAPRYFAPVGYAAIDGLIRDPRFVGEASGVRRYRFRPNPAFASSDHEAMLYRDLEGEILVRTAGEAPWIETVRLFAPQPFKPAPPAKIKRYERRFDFVAWNPFTEGPGLKRYTATTAGKVFFDAFEHNSTAEVTLLGPVEVPDLR